jgi:hypothetical protein
MSSAYAAPHCPHYLLYLPILLLFVYIGSKLCASPPFLWIKLHLCPRFRLVTSRFARCRPAATTNMLYTILSPFCFFTHKTARSALPRRTPPFLCSWFGHIQTPSDDSPKYSPSQNFGPLAIPVPPIACQRSVAVWRQPHPPTAIVYCRFCLRGEGGV